MEILFSLGQATMGDLAQHMDAPPTRPALRSIIKMLEQKGHLVQCGTRGREHVFKPARAPEREGQAAWRKVLSTFFGGSMRDGLAAYLNDPSVNISAEEIETIEGLLAKARQRSQEDSSKPKPSRKPKAKGATKTHPKRKPRS